MTERPRVPNWKRQTPRVHLTSRVVDAFRRYHDEHRAWGAFHGVLDDGNCHNAFCDGFNDAPPLLASWLQHMSPTQRGRLARIAGRQP